MMAKNYLFASVTSTLFLLLVVPLLSAPQWITGRAVSIATLSFFTVSVGGLVAETFEVVTNRRSSPRSQRNAKGYFMSVASSLLFFTIVAPSITLAINSNGVVNAASASALLALSLGIGGLTTDGFFALFSKTSILPPRNQNNEKRKIQQQHAIPSENDVVDVLLGKAKLGGK
jgi:hypothetical protein